MAKRIPRKVKKYLDSNTEEIDRHLDEYVYKELNNKVEDLVYHLNYKFHRELEYYKRLNETTMEAFTKMMETAVVVPPFISPSSIPFDVQDVLQPKII